MAKCWKIYREDNENEFASAISLSSDGNTVALNALRRVANAYVENEGLVKVYTFVNEKWTKLGQSITDYGYHSDTDNIVLSANGRSLVVGSGKRSKYGGPKNVKVFKLGSYKETPSPTNR
mmetsp:Transcript_8827/g.13258  ORF Transcript_8827/g.13258 Transcript_8827/m.13258 type:complete len:120 (+) Transcript_8827:669-1028(+)